MRTLDEVIKAVEEDFEQAAVSYPESFYDYDTHKDALYYLKMYRSDRIQWEADRKNWRDQYAQAVENFSNATAKHLEVLKEIKGKNDPLDWETLKQMEGKPVWVVTGTKGGRWGMFDGVWTKDNEDCVMFVYGHRKYAVCKIRLLGKTWQAYRKERS